MTNGYLRIAAVSPAHRVADVEYNVCQIIDSMRILNDKGVEIAVYPELCITGYTCGDLFHNATLLNAAWNGLQQIVRESAVMNLHVIVGLPVRRDTAVYNCAALVREGQVELVDKTYLPNYNEFNERRWFASAVNNADRKTFISHGVKIGIELCEDLWVPIPPSSYQAMSGAEVIFNLSASNALVGKHSYLKSLITQQSARCVCAYAYASAGFGESTTDAVFLPHTIIAECGGQVWENDADDFMTNPYVIADVDIEAINQERCRTTTFADCAKNNECVYADNEDVLVDEITDFLPRYRKIDAMPFVPEDENELSEHCSEISTIQSCGLATRLKAVGSNRIVVGISGGLDSTLALLVAVRTLKVLDGDLKDIIAVTMPGFGTTDRTYDNALKLMRLLGVTMREVPIVDAVNLHFRDIGHDASVHDVTYENSQARERTQILMDIANQEGALVLGTGDLSELALGWATYNGDHMSMYGVNGGVPKTLVKYLVRWYAMHTTDKELQTTLLDIVDTPISPELMPADDDGNIQQKTEELVGPYELHDFFIYYMLRFGFTPRRVYMLARIAFTGKFADDVILSWLKVFYRRFFTQQFKRSCLPDGPKVGSVCLSPRGDWRMPSDASMALWIKEVESL